MRIFTGNLKQDIHILKKLAIRNPGKTLREYGETINTRAAAIRDALTQVM